MATVFGAESSRAGTFTAFGPKDYTRRTGDPVTVTDTFSVLNPNTQYTLKAFNGGLQNSQTELVSSTVVTLNGVQVIGPSNFNQNVAEVDVAVTLQASNTLSVQVRGQPGGVLTIQIVGVDNDLPTIKATVSPAPNAAGWNNTNVTVTFTCSDVTSAVTCPPAQTVTTEGAKQVISGTAQDAAGNTASTSVTLNIDKTPPTITATTSPAPNAAGWNNSNVTVTFTCNDSLSGVANCPSPVTVSTEGANQVISGTATDVAGNTATTSATINLDKTPPTISITSPTNGATFTSASVSVTGSVSDALSGVSAVSCNGVPATIQTGSFSCSVTLTAGANTITAQATDVAGNISSASVNVTFQNVPPPSINSFSPTSAPVGSLVTLTGSNFTGSGGTTPQVTLNQQGGGSIPAPISSFTATSIAFVIPAGAASGPVTVTVGNQTAASSSTLTIQAASSFTLTAVPGSANVAQGQSTAYALTLNSTDGFSQLAALSVSGLPSGLTAAFNPQQITAGQTSVLTITAPASQATGSATLTVTASATVQGIPETQSATLTLNVQVASTGFTGRTVVANTVETPLAGVTVTFLGVDDNAQPTGCSATTQSDAAGNFLFLNLPAACVGRQLVRYSGTTVTSPPGRYAGVDLVYAIVAGQITTAPRLVHLPRIDDKETVTVKQNAPVDQTFTFASIPGLAVTVYAGTTFRLVDGMAPDPFPLTAVEVALDRLPDVKPPSPQILMVFIVAFQPADATTSQPVAVTFPNRINTPPGTNMMLLTLDPTKGAMVQYGTGTVTGDGTQILPDFDPAHPGHRFGLVHFDWHGPMPPPPPNTNPSRDPNKPKTGDPVDTATGLLVVTKTDIAFGGARGQVAIVRMYRTLSGNPGPFGIGTNHNYGYLLDASNLIRGTGTLVNLVMPDGNQFPFAEQGTGTFVNSTIPTFLGAVITNPSFGTYNLRFKDGTVYQFRALAGPLLAFLTSITDPNGNTTILVRGNATQPAQITQIVDPVGRALNLTYDTFNRITSITDPIGRTVQYTYNSQGTLATVTDAAGGVTTYTYDTQNRMTSITDPRGITFLQNTYDANGRVMQQTAADGGVTTFAYTLLNPTAPAVSPVLLTTVTDPLGHQTTYRFNQQGFLLDFTDALGEKTIYNRDLGTNQVLSITDPLGRTTAFTYDANGNTTSITRLALPPGTVVVGGASPVTTSFTYDPTFNKVTGITDPLGHTTTFKYDQAGNLLSVTDPLSEQTRFAYDTNGELTGLTDPLGNTTQFTYFNGDLIRITDPLNRMTSRLSDAVDRLISQTNPIGQTTQYQYSPLNQLAQITDSLGHQTSFTYDGNGNLLNFADAKGNKMSYTYDPMDRLATRTDPLTHAESYQYDLDGNLAHFTDRRSVATTYSYDALNRRVQANFGSQESIGYSYDAGGRLIRAADSITGTIARSYDGLDRLISETSPQGNVSYSYDAAGRRTSMAVGGQRPVSYSYDSGNRLVQIAQGTSTVTFAYDGDGRRTSLTLPNGVTMSYSYDAASQLTGINYGSLGNLTYSYDLAGRRTNVGGSFARTGMPNALASASYNAGNQVTQFGPSNLTYDANGNLTSDGTNTYTWGARNQLISISGGVAANFQYDAFGRRVSKTVGGTTQYLYDGVNPIEELSGATVSATTLAGLAVDDYLQRTDASGASVYLTDALGSTIALTSAAGALGTQYTYEPFGNTISTGPASANPLQFTARGNDATGLYFYRARYYSPTLQRFVSQDPIEFAGGFNLYAYAGNDPVGFFDPLGLDKKQPCSSPWNRVAAAAGGVGNIALGTVKIALGLGVTAESGGLAVALGYYSAWSGFTNIVAGVSQVYGAATGNLAAGQTVSDYAASASTVSGIATFAATGGNAQAGATASTIEGLALVGVQGALVSTGRLPVPGAQDDIVTGLDNGPAAANLIAPGSAAVCP